MFGDGKMDMESIVCTIIANAGDARSECFRALRLAREGKLTEADQAIEKSKEAFYKAHDVQTKLLQEEALGNNTQVSLLLMHAEDHLMNAMLARELITEMIELYKVIYDGKVKMYER